MRPNLVEWQYSGYPQFHASKLNLLIHLVAVPVFVLSALDLVWALVRLDLVFAAASLGGMVLGFAAQAVGHGREKNPAIPFDGPVDAFARIFTEQFFNFPRFVFSGGWLKAFRAAQ